MWPDVPPTWELECDARGTRKFELHQTPFLETEGNTPNTFDTASQARCLSVLRPRAGSWPAAGMPEPVSSQRNNHGPSQQPRQLKSQNVRDAVRMRRTREKGTWKNRWATRRRARFQYFSTAPVLGGVASGQNRQNILRTRSFLPSSGSSEPSPRTPTTKCEAGREPFDELRAWIFSPTLTRHTTYRVISAPHVATPQSEEKRK